MRLPVAGVTKNDNVRFFFDTNKLNMIWIGLKTH